MADQVDTDALKRAAQAIFDTRVDAVVQIAKAHADMVALREQAAEAERLYGSVWAAGLREGWTETELRNMDLTAPGRKAPVRPRRRAKPGASAGSPTEQPTELADVADPLAGNG